MIFKHSWYAYWKLQYRGYEGFDLVGVDLWLLGYAGMSE